MGYEEEWPEVGELVVATVKKIVDYGAYVTLDEYEGKEGLLHISEISTRWVRNIRNHVREGQKLILRVLRVNRERGHIDLSLKRVSKGEQKEKREEFKKERRAQSLLAQSAKLLNMSEEDLYQKAGIPIVEKYGNLYDGLEEAAKSGVKALGRLDIPDEILEALVKLAKEKVKIRIFKVRGTINATCRDPKGVLIIRDALMGAKKLGRKRRIDVEIYTLGAQRYRMELTADDHRRLERVLKEIVSEVASAIEKAGGTASFTRE